MLAYLAAKNGEAPNEKMRQGVGDRQTGRGRRRQSIDIVAQAIVRYVPAHVDPFERGRAAQVAAKLGKILSPSTVYAVWDDAVSAATDFRDTVSKKAASLRLLLSVNILHLVFR